MSEQVMMSRELLERLAKDGEVIGDADFWAARSELRVAMKVSAQPDDDDDYMPAGIVEGIMRSGTVDAVSMAAQSLRAQPAGEVPEVVGYLNDIGLHWTRDSAEFYGSPVRELIDKAQHTRIIADLQARAVVMPERKTKADYYVYIDEFANEAAAIANAVLDEVARLNGKDGV